jgi:CheY-like chemotaxis protein
VGSRVLVIDDEPGIRLVASTALEGAGFAVETAENGIQALSMCAQHDPDVIVVDLEMPVLGGRAFVDAYRATPTANARIVVISGNSAESEARALGCDFGLAKPFSMDELLVAVQHLSRSPA